MTNEQTMRYNELMRIAKGNEYMSIAEFDELYMLMKIRGYHQATLPRIAEGDTPDSVGSAFEQTFECYVYVTIYEIPAFSACRYNKCPWHTLD